MDLCLRAAHPCLRCGSNFIRRDLQIIHPHPPPAEPTQPRRSTVEGFSMHPSLRHWYNIITSFIIGAE